MDEKWSNSLEGISTCRTVQVAGGSHQGLRVRVRARVRVRRGYGARSSSMGPGASQAVADVGVAAEDGGPGTWPLDLPGHDNMARSALQRQRLAAHNLEMGRREERSRLLPAGTCKQWRCGGGGLSRRGPARQKETHTLATHMARVIQASSPSDAISQYICTIVIVMPSVSSARSNLLALSPRPRPHSRPTPPQSPSPRCPETWLSGKIGNRQADHPRGSAPAQAARYVARHGQ